MNHPVDIFQGNRVSGVNQNIRNIAKNLYTCEIILVNCFEARKWHLPVIGMVMW